MGQKHAVAISQRELTSTYQRDATRAVSGRHGQWIETVVNDLTLRPRTSIEALDVLRTIAVVLVISGHLAGEFHDKLPIFKLPLFYYGWTGVDLFFVLSGFLIGKQLWAEMRSIGHINIGQFVLRRAFRIWPLYYALAFSLISVAAVLRRPMDGFLADLFFASK